MAKEDSTEYRPLITDSHYEGEGDETEKEVQSNQTRGFKKFRPTYRALVVVIAIQTLVLFSIALALFLKRGSSTYRHGHNILYSPALDAVENEIRVFHVGFTGDLSPFQIPSSPELDQAWEDLYGFGISKITKDEAARLPNKTHAIPGDETHYIAELDVFHNLHCLNMVRKALDPAYYPEWNVTASKKSYEHVNHCVDWIRQSIMCHADTSVIVWQWEDWINKSIVKGDIAHTCRKYDKIQDWAKERIMDLSFDPNVRIEDDIVVPILHTDDL